MTVDIDQKCQERVEADAKIIFQQKQIDQINKGHDWMAITAV